jgi:hypothetical protein
MENSVTLPLVWKMASRVMPVPGMESGSPPVTYGVPNRKPPPRSGEAFAEGALLFGDMIFLHLMRGFHGPHGESTMVWTIF